MKGKKLLAGILSAAMVFCSMSFPAFADEVQTTDENTENETTVTLSTAQDFTDFIASIDNNSAYEGKTIKLSQDIDLNGAALTQNVGNFAGTFDGDNHTVSNFTMTKPLFSAQLRKMATVKNFAVENVTLTNTEYEARLGIICRNNNGIIDGVKVKNCTIDSPNTKLGIVGGIAASVQDDSTTKNCTIENFTVNAPMGAVAVGGAFGLLTGNANTKVEGITSSDVKITATSDTQTGSCFGTRQGDVSDDNVKNITTVDPVVTTLSYVAEANDVKYTSLPAAIKNATNGTTITLIEDIHIGLTDMTKYATAYGKEYFYWAYVANKKITIDFATHSIDFKDDLKQYTCSDSNLPFYQIFYLGKDADLTVTGNGIIDVDVDANANADAYIFAAGSAGNINIIIENGTFYGAPCVIKNSNTNNVIKINGGTFGITDTYKQNNPQQIRGVLNTDSTGSKAIQLYGGTIIDNNPRFFDDGDLVATGYAVEKIGKNYNVIPESDVIATLTSTYDGYNAQYQQTRWDNVPATYGYKTLAEAIANAKGGDTVTLLANASGDGIVIDDAKFNDNGLTIDLNGFTYTVSGKAVGSVGSESNGFQLLKDNNITIKNGTLTTAETLDCVGANGAYTAGAFTVIMNYSNLTLDGVTLDGTNLRDGGYTLSNNNGNTEIKNSTIEGAPSGHAFDICDYADYEGAIVKVDANSTITGYVEISNHNGGEMNSKLTDSEGNDYTADGDYVREGAKFKKVETTEEPGMLDKILLVSNKDIIEKDGIRYYPLQFFAGIDSLNYKNVGFDITAKRTGYTSEPKTITTKDVYTSMTVTSENGNSVKYTPDQLCGKFIFGAEFLFNTADWKNEDTEITISAFATTLDGEKIVGETKTITNDKLTNSVLFKEDKTNEN